MLEVRARRKALGVRAAFYRVDTCAAEFESNTPYLYSHYEGYDESEPTARKKIMILGGGPNRIGQGIEFDYCCVHACYALRAAGSEAGWRRGGQVAVDQNGVRLGMRVSGLATVPKRPSSAFHEAWAASTSSRVRAT